MPAQDIRQAIQSAQQYLLEHPTEARYTDSQATARLTGGLQVTVEGPGNASLSTDMPRSVGGTDSAPSPGWFLRAAEAACVATLIAMRAAELGLELDEVRVTVDSVSDDRGILGVDANTPAGPLSTRVAATVRCSGADGQQLRDLVNWAVEHCPVTDAVRRAVPLTVEVEAG